jgi:hypothetical protein
MFSWCRAEGCRPPLPEGPLGGRPGDVIGRGSPCWQGEGRWVWWDRQEPPSGLSLARVWRPRRSGIDDVAILGHSREGAGSGTVPYDLEWRGTSQMSSLMVPAAIASPFRQAACQLTRWLLDC